MLQLAVKILPVSGDWSEKNVISGCYYLARISAESLKDQRLFLRVQVVVVTFCNKTLDNCKALLGNLTSKT